MRVVRAHWFKNVSFVFSFRLTNIAVDWQVSTAEGRNYDVMFMGTTHGHVLKALNKRTEGVDQVVVEDIVVFDDGRPVVELRIHEDDVTGQKKLIVVSEAEIKALPLQRCHVQNTCR